MYHKSSYCGPFEAEHAEAEHAEAEHAEHVEHAVLTSKKYNKQPCRFYIGIPLPENLQDSKGLITWQISAQAEISARSTGLKFCCDYMTNFSPG